VAPKLQVIPGAKETTPDTGVIVRCARCRARIPVDAKQCPMCGHIVKPAAERKGDARAARETTQISAKRKVAGYLISVSAVDGRETVKVPIFEGKNTLGRERSDLQFPEDDLLSPQHLVVEVTEGAPLLKCLGSRNGTFVRLLDQVLLEHGDTFRVGQQLLRYEDLDILDPVVAPAEEGTEVMGSPAGPRVWGRLTQVVTETLAGASFLLANENVFLGRERGNITFPGDRYISGTHAVLIHKPDGTYLRDVGSSNGTYVRVKGELPLQSGQYFLAGRQLFKLQIGQ
jgi:pSer/pThr/pTyr-binding forkhead associated (FHA) protein